MRLWEEAKKITPNTQPKKVPKKKYKKSNWTQEKINVDKARVLAHVGKYAHAFTLLGSLGVAEQNEDTYQKLLSKKFGITILI